MTSKQLTEKPMAVEPEPPSSCWHLYLIRCSNNSLYTGITTDIERRFLEHQSMPQGSKYLRGKGPLQLAYQCEIGDKGLALKVEHRVKQLQKAQKERLVQSGMKKKQLLDFLDMEVS